MLEKLTANEVTETIIIVLLAYHIREAMRIEAVIDKTGLKNQWHELWPKLQQASENDEVALSHFTQYIMAQLDGGEYIFLDGLNLE